MASVTTIPTMTLFQNAVVQFTPSPPVTDQNFTLSLDRGIEGGLNYVGGAQLSMTFWQTSGGAVLYVPCASGSSTPGGAAIAMGLAGQGLPQFNVILGSWVAGNVPLLLVFQLLTPAPVAIAGTFTTS